MYYIYTLYIYIYSIYIYTNLGTRMLLNPKPFGLPHTAVAQIPRTPTESLTELRTALGLLPAIGEVLNVPPLTSASTCTK